MAEYRNDTKGPRGIRLTGGGHAIVAPGATLEISEDRVNRAHPDLKLVRRQVSKAPAKAVAAVTGKKPQARRAPAKRKAAAKPKAG